jgi:hypothetical protein
MSHGDVIRATVAARRVTDIDCMTREEAIARIRERLVSLTDDDSCMCKVAAERGIFCRGFRQWSDGELRERYWWVVRKNPDITRAELESVANQWQLAQQDVRQEGLACDVQASVHDTCRGWEDFSTDDLIELASS